MNRYVVNLWASDPRGQNPTLLASYRFESFDEAFWFYIAPDSVAKMEGWSLDNWHWIELQGPGQHELRQHDLRPRAGEYCPPPHDLPLWLPL